MYIDFLKLFKSLDIDNYFFYQIKLFIMSIILYFTKTKYNPINGDIDEKDYDKDNLYGLLYNVYDKVGIIENEKKQKYQFTFNTWGFHHDDSIIDKLDPQIFGKTAYSMHFTRNDSIKTRILEMKKSNQIPKILELGCGTGAGAYLIANEVFNKHYEMECEYIAIDMQAKGINTAKKIHKHPNIKFIHKNITELHDDFGKFDFILINETHIFEMSDYLTNEDVNILNIVSALLKSNGYFLWGNAIPDPIWNLVTHHLIIKNIKLIHKYDYTENAIKARDLDTERVNLYCDSIYNNALVYKIPILGENMRNKTEIMLKNFFRHPGTNLYNNMVSRTDTYYHLVFQKS